MNCWLHIGGIQTNSSLVRDFLSLNSLNLLCNDFLYINNYFSTEEILLAAYGKNDRNILANYELKSSQSTLILKIKKFTEIFSPKNILVSSDFLLSHLESESDLLSLKSMLSTIGVNDIKIIFYIRNQIGLLISLSTYLLQLGYSNSKLPMPYESTETSRFITKVCDYKQSIQALSEVFGQANLIIRTCNRQSLKHGSILKDFSAILDLDLDYFPYEKKQNKPLSNLGFELLSRVNKRISVENNSIRVALRKKILDIFKDLFSGEGYSLSLELHQAYQEAFKESNEWVRDAFFSERQSLFPDIPLPEPVSLGFTSKELDNIANLLADIWLEREKDLR